MRFIEKLLKSFDYNSLADLGFSLSPSYKYGMIPQVAGVSAVLVFLEKTVDTIFGLNGLSFLMLMVVFIAELFSGIKASQVRKEPFSSMKLSRFSFKVFYYLILIAVPYAMYQNFAIKDKGLASTVFDWLHMFLTIQIVFENIFSILENVAVISGKDKTHWITKIKKKFKDLV